MGEKPSLMRSLILLFIISVFLFFVFRSRPSNTKVEETRPALQYAVVVDAGSTGTRIHVFQFMFTKLDGPQIVSEVFHDEIVSLASFSDDPNSVQGFIEPLVDVAIDTVPKEKHHCTPIILRATTGLRLISKEVAQEILKNVLFVFQQTQFFVPKNSVEILDGGSQGIYSWTATNFLLKRLGMKEKKPTVAVIDVGGGSAQIVYEVTDPKYYSSLPQKVTQKFTFGQFKYNLYHRSFLGFGIMEAISKSKSLFGSRSSCLPHLIKDDKVLKGRSLEKSNDEAESKEGDDDDMDTDDLDENLDDKEEKEKEKESDEDEENGKEDDEEDNEEEKPDVYKTDTFDLCYPQMKEIIDSSSSVFRTFKSEQLPSEIYGCSYIYDRTQFRTPVSPLPISKLEEDAREFCDKEFEDPENEEANYCHDLTYLYTFLTYGLDIEENSLIYPTRKIDGYSTGWPIGAAINIIEHSDVECTNNY